MGIDHSYTVNGRLMTDAKVLIDVEGGIEKASDAIIPAMTSLYRAGHAFRNGAPQKPESAFNSPWWSMYYDFNAVTWQQAGSPQGLPDAARAAFAIHPEWGTDCSQFASIVTRVDLSVWYGIGKSVWGVDPATHRRTRWNASQEILQIYIPGFKDNAAHWSEARTVYRVGNSFSNGAGCQAVVPGSLRTDSRSAVVQMQGDLTWRDLR